MQYETVKHGHRAYRLNVGAYIGDETDYGMWGLIHTVRHLPDGPGRNAMLRSLLVLLSRGLCYSADDAPGADVSLGAQFDDAACWADRIAVLEKLAARRVRGHGVAGIIALWKAIGAEDHGVRTVSGRHRHTFTHPRGSYVAVWVNDGYLSPMVDALQSALDDGDDVAAREIAAYLTCQEINGDTLEDEDCRILQGWVESKIDIGRFGAVAPNSGSATNDR